MAIIDDFRQPAYLKLSVQRALLGQVTSNLAGLFAVLEGDLVRIDAYFFEQATEDDHECIEEAAAYVIADFPPEPNFQVETNYYLAAEAYPGKVAWNFLRAEMMQY